MISSCVLIGLLGLLGGFLWWWIFLPRVHVFGLPVVHYDVLAVPPVPFSAENTERLISPPPIGPKSHKSQNLLRLETSEGIATLGGALKGLVPRTRDLFVLYLSGQGVAVDGKAYLLCSDFPQSGDSSKVGLRRILQQISECPASQKIVLLDVCWTSQDPWLGFTINEFARLVRTDVKAVDDDSLWVVNSCGPLELGHASYPQQCSVFARFAADALTGYADEDGNGVVELDEFFRFTRSGTAGWVQRNTSGTQNQLPELLRGGVGITEEPAVLALVSVSEAIAAVEESAVEESEDDPESDVEGGEEGASTPGASSNEAPAEGDSEASDDDVRDVAGRARELLIEAWTLRDRLETRTDETAWTPVDYAPHVWRELQQLLLGNEFRIRAGKSFAAEDLQEELASLVSALECFADDKPLPRSIDPSSVVARLADARQAALTPESDAETGEESTLRQAYGQALRLRNDLVFRAPYYVHWHSKVVGESPSAFSLHGHIVELLSNQLPQLDASLASIAKSQPAAGAEVAILRRIQAQAKVIRQQQQRIEEDFLQAEVESVAEDIVESSNPEEAARRIDDLLSTPLISASHRKTLLNAMEGLRAQSTWDSASPPLGARETANNRAGWENALQRSELAVALVRLFDPSVAAVLDKELAGIGRLTPPIAADGEAELWRAYRRCGVGLGEFYRSLPELIRKELDQGDTAAGDRIARLLRAVDPRDCVRVPREACRFALPSLPSPRGSEEMLVLSGPERLEIDEDAWSELVLTVTAGDGGDTALTADYDPDAVILAESGDETPIPPGRTMAVPVQAGQRRDIVFRVRARPDAGQARVSQIAFQAATDAAATSKRIEVAVRPPDRVDLQVVGKGITIDNRLNEQKHTWLRPFPNRTTVYRFELVNRSGESKNVSVVLLGSPPDRESTDDVDAPDRLARWKRNGRLLVGPLPVQLGAAPAPRGLPFPAPESEASTSDDESSENANNLKPVAEEITKGLLCLIREGDDKEWAHWISFSPLLPKEYLEPVVGYDVASQRIEIQIRARDVNGDGIPDPEVLPERAPDHPILVRWETAGVLDPNTVMNDRGTLVSRQDSLNLFAVVEPAAGRRVPVRLTVDGYRQAFSYDVRCDRDRKAIDRERSVRSVAIESPSSGDAFRSPLDVLPVDLHVDAPEDAFRQPGDYVEVGIDANGDRLLRGEQTVRIASDRQETVALEEVGPDGRLCVHTKVEDLHIELMPGGLRNQEVDILARLVLHGAAGNAAGRPAEDSVRVILDGASPEVRVTILGRAASVGREVAVTIRADDLSGVEKVEVGFDLDRSLDFEEPENAKTLRQPVEQDTWSTRLPTEGMEPGRYRVLARVTDRVGLSQTEHSEVTLEAAQGGMAEKTDDTSTIRGRVLLVDRPAGGMRVVLEGTAFAAVTDSAGNFEFRDVPHGTYTLQAKGVALNQFREGSTQVVLPASAEPAQLTVQVE